MKKQKKYYLIIFTVIVFFIFLLLTVINRDYKKYLVIQDTYLTDIPDPVERNKAIVIEEIKKNDTVYVYGIIYTKEFMFYEVKTNDNEGFVISEHNLLKLE